MKGLGQFCSLLLLAGGVLFQPGAAQATITLCNSSAGEMGISVVLEDPNLLLFTRYPYTSRGLYTLRPAQCFDVSMGRSDGMRVHFQTYYQAEDGSWHPGQYDVRNAREVQRSGRQFCTHPNHGWDLSRENAVNCPPGYQLSDFGYKLVVPGNAWDFRLSLTADRLPPASSEAPKVSERLDDADRLDRLLKDGLAGKECRRAEDVWMRYMKNDVSVTPQGILRAHVENWHEGKLTSSSTAEVRIQDIAHVAHKKIEECYVLDLICNRAAISEKGRLGHCVKSTSLGTTDSLRLYFPSELGATKFWKLASRNFSTEAPSNSSEY